MRATAMVEFVYDSRCNVQPRLQPLIILDNNQFYDASIYKRAPEPLALQTGTVYDVQKTGESLGFVSIRQSQRNAAQAWLAMGDWKPNAPVAETTAGPVIVKRDGGDDDDAPPVLKRGSGAPQVKRSEVPAQDANATAVAEDPNRPRLRRGRGQQQVAAEKPRDCAAETVERRKKDEKLPPEFDLVGREYLAISDAQPYTPNTYVFDLRVDEADKLRREMIESAKAELRKELGVAAQPAQPERRTARGRRPAAAAPEPLVELQEITLRILDLDTDNYPEVVFTAVSPLNGEKRFVTVVARLDSELRPRTLFQQITRVARLDVTPRLEWLDAIDVDGDNRGDLVFREYSSDTIDAAPSAFLFLRAGRDKAERIFQKTAPSE